MSCNRIADWYEHHGDQELSHEWEEILVHSARCPDCSLVRLQRGWMLELLEEVEPVDLPEDFHSTIMDTIELHSASAGMAPSAPGIIDRLLDAISQPIQVGVTVACLAMAFSLFSLDHARNEFSSRAVVRQANSGASRVKANPTEPTGEKLVKLSEEEVQEFLDRLVEFRRKYPAPAFEKRLPGVRLVGF